MLRALKSLLVFLMVAALGVVTVATASPCAGHPFHVLQERAHAGQIASPCVDAANEFGRHAATHHGTAGKCVHPCCVAPMAAALIGGIRAYVALPTSRAAYPFPNDDILTGIAVAPLTGPPKFSA